MLRAAIQRPIAISMLFAALLLVGVLSYQRLAVDLLPSITYPRLTILTVYADIPAEDLERLVTQRLEEVVTALTAVRGVASRTREGLSIITVEYEWGTQMDFANLHLREAVDRVAFRDDFPEAAERPVILRWDPTSRPVSILVLQGEVSVAKDALEACLQFWFAGGHGLGRVGCQGAVVDEEFEFMPVEFQRTVSRELSFQKPAGIGGRPKRLAKAILVAAIHRCLTVVAQSIPVVGVVHAVIGLVADQHHAGPARHVAVIGHVDQQLIQHLVANPLVKDFNETSRGDVQVAIDVDLHIDVLKFHHTLHPGQPSGRFIG